MKRRLFSLLFMPLLFGCYEDYVKDYDYDGVYIAYQYDLRSFIVGESSEFKLGVVLGGTIYNDRDREVRIALDDELLKKDLSVYGGDASFTALDGLKGFGKCGAITQSYVSDAMADVTSIKFLPSSYYTISDENRMVIEKGRNSASVTVIGDMEKLLKDKNFGVKPYYALAFRIISADADTVLRDKSFEIVMLRAENMFFGDWYHGGRSVTVRDSTGEIVSDDIYPTTIPCDENTSSKYTLTTATPTTVTTDYFHNRAGSMTISMDGENVGISSPDGTVVDLGCSWNAAKLLQDRKIYLNYKYTSTNGTTTTVNDTLTFRARLHDGANEWQDTDPEHYE